MKRDALIILGLIVATLAAWVGHKIFWAPPTTAYWVEPDVEINVGVFPDHYEVDGVRFDGSLGPHFERYATTTSRVQINLEGDNDVIDSRLLELSRVMNNPNVHVAGMITHEPKSEKGSDSATEVSLPLTGADEEVLTIALEAFAKGPDSSQYNHNNSHAYVAVAPVTKTTTNDFPDYADFAPGPDLWPRAPRAAIEDFLARNRHPFAATSLKSSSGSFRIQDNEKDWEEPLHIRATDVRTIVRISVPGYSPDGKWALVKLYFRWSGWHRADAVYLLRHTSSGWTIAAQDFLYGV